MTLTECTKDAKDMWEQIKTAKKTLSTSHTIRVSSKKERANRI